MIAKVNDVRRPHAQIDVSIDTRALAGGPVQILFDAFGTDGALIAGFGVITSQDGFASSSWAGPPNDNLFKLSGGSPALVRVRTPQAADTGAALLRQTRLTRQGVAKPDMVLGLRPIVGADGTTVAMGREFAVTIGEIATRATLLIGNVSDADVVADVYQGTTGGVDAGKYTNLRLPNRHVWIVNLDPTDANSNLAVAGTGDLVFQLAVEGGRLARRGDRAASTSMTWPGVVERQALGREAGIHVVAGRGGPSHAAGRGRGGALRHGPTALSGAAGAKGAAMESAV